MALRKEFGQKPGYIREKKGDELAIQSAKKVFGDFMPGNKEAMKANNNNGKGVNVQLATGIKSFANQLELYNDVVKHNQENGGFFDRKVIAKVNPEDLKRLDADTKQLEDAKEALVNAFGPENKNQGYETIREIEQEVRKSYDVDSKANNSTKQVAEPDNSQKPSPTGQNVDSRAADYGVSHDQQVPQAPQNPNGQPQMVQANAFDMIGKAFSGALAAGAAVAGVTVGAVSKLLPGDNTIDKLMTEPLVSPSPYKDYKLEQQNDILTGLQEAVGKLKSKCSELNETSFAEQYRAAAKKDLDLGLMHDPKQEVLTNSFPDVVDKVLDLDQIQQTIHDKINQVTSITDTISDELKEKFGDVLKDAKGALESVADLMDNDRMSKLSELASKIGDMIGTLMSKLLPSVKASSSMSPA